MSEPIVVHCFWLSCNHVVEGNNPQMAHDQMERHYQSKHQEAIDALVGAWPREEP